MKLLLTTVGTMKRSGGVTYAVGLSPRKTIRGGDINFNDHEGFLVLLHFHIFM